MIIRGMQWVRGISSIVAVALCVGVATGQAIDPRLRRVLDDWQKRQDRVKTIRYAVEGDVVIPRTRLTGDPEMAAAVKGDLAARDLITPKKVLLLIDFPTNRHRLEKEAQELMMYNGQVAPRVSTTVFNGKALKTAMPREANTNAVHKPHPNNPDVSIQTGKLDMLTSRRTMRRCFSASGLFQRFMFS